MLAYNAYARKANRGGVRRTRSSTVRLAAALGLVGLAVLALGWLGGIDRYKHRLETAASDALGMEVRIRGHVRLGLFPDLHVTVEDGEILDEQGVAVFSAKRGLLGIEPLPLLRRQLRVTRIQLTQPRLSIERDRNGTLNVDRLERNAAELLAALNEASVSLRDGAMGYTDRRAGTGFEAAGLNVAVSRIRVAGGNGPQPWKRLSLQAKLSCAEIRTKELSLTGLKIVVDGKDGVYEIDPVAMRLFGGEMVGSVRADLSASVPVCQIRCALPGFRIEEFFKTLSPTKAVEGAMDFSATLSMRGGTMSEMMRAASGDVSLHGENLTLIGNDLDKKLSRFESSQNFNLVDVGAVFFAGPFGLGVTRGYGFGSLFRASGGSSRIRTVVSTWTVAHGVAQAKDVAMATSKNRIALRGGLDFVSGRFADVTVAVIDAKGCATVQQAIRGPFGEPEVEKPHVLRSLAGPVVRLFQKARGLFPAGPCEVFYSGSVAPPR